MPFVRVPLPNASLFRFGVLESGAKSRSVGSESSLSCIVGVGMGGVVSDSERSEGGKVEGEDGRREALLYRPPASVRHQTLSCPNPH